MILLFGASGQLGQALRAEALRKDVAIAPASFERRDIADAAQVRQAFRDSGARIVVNAAAYTAVDRAEAEADLAERTNATGAGVVARAAEETGLPLVHISTDYVFDGNKDGPYDEDDLPAPIGAYGRSKSKGEALVRRHHPEHVILRTSWLYSRYGHNFLKTMTRLAASSPQLRIVSDQHGTPTSATDLAQAILDLAPRLADPDFSGWGTYHYAGEGSTTWHGLACRIVDAQAAITGCRPAVVPIATADYPTAALRPRNSVLSTERFTAQFGISARPWPSSVDHEVGALFGRHA